MDHGIRRRGFRLTGDADRRLHTEVPGGVIDVDVGARYFGSSLRPTRDRRPLISLGADALARVPALAETAFLTAREPLDLLFSSPSDPCTDTQRTASVARSQRLGASHSADRVVVVSCRTTTPRAFISLTCRVRVEHWLPPRRTSAVNRPCSSSGRSSGCRPRCGRSGVLAETGACARPRCLLVDPNDPRSPERVGVSAKTETSVCTAATRSRLNGLYVAAWRVLARTRRGGTPPGCTAPSSSITLSRCRGRRPVRGCRQCPRRRGHRAFARRSRWNCTVNAGVLAIAIPLSYAVRVAQGVSLVPQYPRLEALVERPFVPQVLTPHDASMYVRSRVL